MKSSNVTVETENIQMTKREWKKGVILTPFTMGENGEIFALAKLFCLSDTVGALRQSVRRATMPKDEDVRFFPFMFLSTEVMTQRGKGSPLMDWDVITARCVTTFGSGMAGVFSDNASVVDLSALNETPHPDYTHYGVFVPPSIFYSGKMLCDYTALSKDEARKFAEAHDARISELSEAIDSVPGRRNRLNKSLARLSKTILDNGGHIGRSSPTFLMSTDYYEIIKGMEKFEADMKPQIDTIKAELERTLGQ